jgi:prevent-host-death family protein
MTKTAAVADLKAHLSSYLRRVKAGEEILVTERNVPVARLAPVGPTETLEDGMRDLQRQGLIRLGTGKLPTDFWKLPRGRDLKATVRRAVSEERERGW